MSFFRKELKEIELKKVYFISSKLDLFLEKIEPKNPYSQEEQKYRFWVKTNTTSFYKQKNTTYDLPLYKLKNNDSSYRFEIDSKVLNQTHFDYLVQKEKFFSYSDAISEENIGNYYPLAGEPLEKGELLQLQDFSEIKLNIPSLNSEKKEKIIGLFSKNLAVTPDQARLLLLSLGIRDLVNGNMPKKNGAILYGPPGTGKTRAMDVYFKLFKDHLKFNLVKIDATDLINNAVVGGFASRISEKIFQPAVEKILSTKKPCLIYVDEATALVSKPKESNVSDWYQEGLDTIKRFLNTQNFPGIIMCMATNAKYNDLDKTIVKRRLTGIEFDFLDQNQFKSLWEFKLKDNMNTTYSPDQINKLSQICSNAINGAYVDSFTMDYEDFVSTKKSNQRLSSNEEIRDFYSAALSSKSEFISFPFDEFYIDFLNDLLNYLNNEIKSEKENVNSMHYMSEVEKENRIEEATKFMIKRISMIQKELDLLKNNENNLSQTQQQTNQNTSNPQQNSTTSDQQFNSAITQCLNFISMQQNLFSSNQFDRVTFMSDFPIINTAFTTVLQRANQTNFNDYSIISGIINQLEQYGTNLTFHVSSADLQRMFTILQNLIPRVL
jgi:ATP-dependent 26S proteasome regulatory subunit